MGAYLRAKLADADQALAANDFVQTIPENQQLLKLDKGVGFVCIDDIIEVEQDDYEPTHKRNIIAMLTRDMGKADYKVSGFDSEDIGGMDMPDFFDLLATVFIKLNEKFKMKYLCSSCAFTTELYYFSLANMKGMTQDGQLLSGKDNDPDKYHLFKRMLQGETPAVLGGNHGNL